MSLSRSLTARPILPWRCQNTEIKKLADDDLPPVKFQLLDRDGQEVLVGRMKVPTPAKGHAFILRRFDTNAISLTTMFRAAFPSASEADERKETNWVKENYPLLGNNGSTKEPQIIRLAGTWIDPELALQFADTYQLGDIISLMAKASPDPQATYRRSSKATPKGKSETTAAQSPTVAAPSAAKRRKEASPAPSATSTKSNKAVSPAPRRSTRRSAQPESAPVSIASVTSPKAARKNRKTAASSAGGSEETVVEEDAEEIATMAGPDASQDIAEQKEMIRKLKAQRANGITLDDKKAKRAREDDDEPLQFEFKEPEVGERAIVTNRKVSRFQMEPRTKSVAWGVAAFAIGMGAVTFLPSLL